MWRKSFSSIILALLALSCTNIDCPLENVVMLRCGIYNSINGSPISLQDTLTICTAGSDSVLYNRAYGISEFSLPMRHREGTDTFLLHFSSADKRKATDTLFVQHTSHVHFEAVDCPASVFHNITGVRHTEHDLNILPLTLDSVAVSRSNVDYDTKQNLQLYLRPAV